ncbi:MAG: cytochrome C biogenesis protein [Elusimicrobia bacterium RIFOXYA2_FULL_40_6]|nr:MAG: cytochrome C biogenesis protein [Elusimicrobia bacterium RIFOXYA2_FULL_40_6]
MLLRIFTWFSGTLQSAPHIALFGSFVWGILSVILSPCHLSSIPLIVGFINGQGKVSVKRAFLISLFFSTGILITIGAIGLLTGIAGRMLGDIGRFGNYFVAAIFFVVGLYLMDIIPLPFLNSGVNQPGFTKKGLFAAFVLGLIFGIALGPCTFAYMAPILGLAFSVAAKNIIFAVSLVFAYALGHISVIVFAGTFSEAVQNYLNWNEKSKGVKIVKNICGMLIILGGAYLIIK